MPSFTPRPRDLRIVKPSSERLRERNARINVEAIIIGDRGIPVALAEDFLKGNLLVAAAVGATALVLPKVLPDLSPSLRSTVKSALSLFLECESEAEGGIVNRLADHALQGVLKNLSGPGSDEDKRKAAGAVVERFKHTARTRARRYGRDETSRKTRYNRHIKALRQAFGRAGSRQTGKNAAALRELSAALDEA